MSSNAVILGFNSRSSVAVAGDSVLLGAGAGVIVREGDESSQWIPGDGRYHIGVMAFCPETSVLCLTEVRLNVSLLVFQLPDCDRLQKIDNVATVDVEDMLFSPDGDFLAMLTCMPSPCVTVFDVQHGMTLKKIHTIALESKFWKSLAFPPQPENSLAILESKSVMIATNVVSEFTTPIVLKLDSNGEEFHSFAWGPEGVFCGADNGSVILFDELKMEMQILLTIDTKCAIMALHRTKAVLLVGTQRGVIFSYDVDKRELKRMISVRHAVERFLACDDESNVLVVSSTDVMKLDINLASSTTISSRNTGNTVKVLVIGSLVVCVSSDGCFMLYEHETNTAIHIAVHFAEKAMDACVVNSVLVVAYDSGWVRCFTLNSDATVMTSQTRVSESPLHMCLSDGGSLVAVCDKSVIHYLSVKDGVLQLQTTSEAIASTITNLCWSANNEQSLLAACSNGEIYLIKYFESDDLGAPAAVIDVIWRLDFPVTELLPLFADDDVINILVHSVDKDTKLYVLERGRDKEGKPLRPLFLMRDHESVGTVLQRLGDEKVISAGVDGRVVVRNISHYLAKLTPIPPSKEKRNPICDYALRPFGKGGIRTLCVWNDTGGFICGGNDTVIHIIPNGSANIEYSWTEPVWTQRSFSIAASGCSSPLKSEHNILGQSKSYILSTLSELREDVGKLLVERTAAVRAEDFLLPEQRDNFNADCVTAIQEAKEDDYYRMVHNEFVQHAIRRDCWNTMEVPQSKIVSLTNLESEVFNFQLRKADPTATNILRKIQFLRKLQLKVGDHFTFASVKFGNKEGEVGEIPAAPQDDIFLEDNTALLYDALDVYTHSRAIIQIILLTGQTRYLKKAFNSRFDALRERKRRELGLIEERNDRCKRILQQLGDTTCLSDILFTPVCDPNEDPTAIFEVFDSEIDPELLKLADKTDDNAYVMSPANEAALKTWMDGLEKAIEVLAVNVPLPPFADETLDQYVSPDERTDEQQRLYEEYEKQVVEQTILVNEQKEALRQELVALKKANDASCALIDGEVVALGDERMKTSQQVDALELQQVNALGRLFLQKAIYREYVSVLQEKAHVDCRLEQLKNLESHRQSLLTSAEEDAQQRIDDERSLISNMRHSPPFSDPDWGDRLYRRFTKWCTRYEGGVAKVPNPGQNGVVPLALFDKYRECCIAVVKAKEAIAHETERVHQYHECLVAVYVEKSRLEEILTRKKKAADACKNNVVQKLLNVQILHNLQQGQVQDERAVVNENFMNFSFRWVSSVTDYNDLIFQSFEEFRRLMVKRSQLRQAMKKCAWDTERLLYCIGTLEMELRQLHTLRVTRQMQESIHTGSVISSGEEVEKLKNRIEAVRSVMTKRVEERDRVIARLKMQIQDRHIENSFLERRAQQIKSVVSDEKAVWDMLSGHNDEKDRHSERMKELFEHSELGELARCQQEELIRLKKEIELLRERTFPSFAVVSKRTVRQ
ncbi:hypothetical protein, conserved [Trypanosoma vivax Y486]|uniref:Cilia- and flagella-associated protein 43 n=1 Tax=Trypanosoma vivax (strain Y486) TaxID=1055687 RepID=F9WM77_TRYVY|nr:hypothetical protein, conserved [Trypanosoma vivax Y486]|eukprot:CCD18628.1 hypothetical protein, conserved [Trypanosoma vivax Y486]